jgi:hypothetical protein
LKTALDFAITILASANHEEKCEQEIYPNIAAVAAAAPPTEIRTELISNSLRNLDLDSRGIHSTYSACGMNEFSGKAPPAITRNNVAKWFADSEYQDFPSWGTLLENVGGCVCCCFGNFRFEKPVSRYIYLELDEFLNSSEWPMYIDGFCGF